VLVVAAFVWFSRDSDDTDDAGDVTIATEASIATDTTPAGSVAPGSTAAPAPSTVPGSEVTTAPTAPVATEPAVTTLPPPPPVSIPPGAVLVTDPAGWTLGVDPAWNDTTGPNGIRTFFIEPGATTGDNVNVSTEVLPASTTLDAYVAAAIANIQSAASDFTIVAQRRETGADGVQIEMIQWVGTLSGLPTLSFLQSVVVSPTTAYIATFTSRPETMPTMAPFLDPFLVTLRGI
jgi:hypothetical protein